MPPRHAYWTILVDEQPTAFRAALVEDLQPTFKRLKEKHPSARVVWFQNGKVWNSRLDAQEAMRARGEMGRKGDVRQGGFRDRPREPRPEQADRRDPSGKLEWKPKGTFQPKAEGRPKREGRPVHRSAEREGGPVHRSAERKSGKSEWRPKGSSPSRASGLRRERPESSRKLEWKPKGPPGATLRPKDHRTPGPRSRPSAKREGGAKLEWKPKGAPGTAQDPRPRSQDPPRKWIPKEEYKKSHGSKPRARDKNWRPGGEHVDPRQKYKDAKKAKWTRFKQNVRKRWETKQPRKKKDDE
jgi:hypothetical protein